MFFALVIMVPLLCLSIFSILESLTILGKKSELQYRLTPLGYILMHCGIAGVVMAKLPMLIHPGSGLLRPLLDGSLSTILLGSVMVRAGYSQIPRLWVGLAAIAAGVILAIWKLSAL